MASAAVSSATLQATEDPAASKPAAAPAKRSKAKIVLPASLFQSVVEITE